MPVIKVQSGLSTKLDNGFDHVSEIEIIDSNPIAGGYGTVYRCQRIDGRNTAIPVVVKIFHEDMPTKDKDFATTQELQAKVDAENQQSLLVNGRPLTKEYPALRGIPQFSFRGIKDGRPVLGFIAEDLDAAGFVSFKDILENNVMWDKYQALFFGKKMSLAFQLASLFSLLEKFLFVHADIKPDAIFINLDTIELAIIDYDSGAIMEKEDDQPTTWGSPNDFVSPEIYRQLQAGGKTSREKVQVNIHSDKWSITVGIHYLLAQAHPLYFLNELSPAGTDPYFQNAHWPQADKNAGYFKSANSQFYDEYQRYYNIWPQPLREKFEHAINFGYARPAARPKYSDWMKVLQPVQSVPLVKFNPAKQMLLKGHAAIIEWEVTGARQVTIDQLGVVAHSGSARVSPTADTIYVLKATGHFGDATASVTIELFPHDIDEKVFVPMPNSFVTLDPEQFVPAPDTFIMDFHKISYNKKPGKYNLKLTKLYEYIRRFLPAGW